jgi:polar amino acid transport system substrate-binding protein
MPLPRLCMPADSALASLIPRLLLAAMLLGAARAGAAELVLTVDTGTEMPYAKIEDGKLVGGLHMDLGAALARAMGRSAVFLVLPRKRIEHALETGSADVLCMYIPAWVPGPYDWSRPFFPHSEVVIADARVPRPTRLSDLAGRRIGTVLGYRHPELEALGSGFVREDGPSAEANLRKLAAGRIQYMVTSSVFLDYRLKQGDLPLVLHEPLLVKYSRAQCAVSRHGHVALAEVDRAIAQIAKDNTLAQILGRYKK